MYPSAQKPPKNHSGCSKWASDVDFCDFKKSIWYNKKKELLKKTAFKAIFFIPDLLFISVVIIGATPGPPWARLQMRSKIGHFLPFLANFDQFR